MNNLEIYFDQNSSYTFDNNSKLDLLNKHLLMLDNFHKENCEDYKKITSNFNGLNWFEGKVYLPVRVFKEFELKSISDKDVFKTLTSSGTTSQIVSKIFLDRETSLNQTKALVKIMQQYLGKDRLPMLIIDHPSVVKDRTSFSARGAGILGLSNFGRDHTYALNDDMSINYDLIEEFLLKHRDKKIFIFGFTFMIWQHFIQELKKSNKEIDLSNSILVHSGGWKKLIDISVDNKVFKQVINDVCGGSKIHNFYGMVEQVGSIFVECSHGYLHAPDYADIEIFRIDEFQPANIGEQGVVAVTSVIPSSYPGHRLITEDLGTIHGIDDCECGKNGKYFSIHGRIPQAELRGCSDTHAISLES